MNQHKLTELQDCQVSQVQRLKELLETERQRQRQLEKGLNEAERRYSSLVDNVPDVVYAMDEEGRFIRLNKAVNAYGFTQGELIGLHFFKLVCDEDQDQVSKLHDALVGQKTDITASQQFRLVIQSGEVRWFEANFSIRHSPEGKFLLHEGVCRDITESMQVRELLMRNQEELEALVKDRTKELMQVNEALQNEISERIQTEQALREREADLQIEKENLQEANTALRVLLKRREMDKRDLEEQVLYNIKELIQPYLDKIRHLNKDESTNAFISIIESNLNDITASFSRRLALEFYDLSKAEFKVANFIRQGKSSREIAADLGLSVRTVEAYRNSIRRKLRIKNRKVNLRTFLLSVS
jgi:PAS domain S-box-containing protein